jgi:hypothetical protein
MSLRGTERLAALCEAFPAVPRSIVIKADVLREGTRYTPDLEEAGRTTFPHSCKGSAWSTDADFRRLVHGCSCDDCG